MSNTKTETVPFTRLNVAALLSTIKLLLDYAILSGGQTSNLENLIL